MQVAGNLAVGVLQRRLVTEDQPADRKFGGDAAADELLAETEAELVKEAMQ